MLEKFKLTKTKLEMLGAVICAMLAAVGIFWWLIHYADDRQLVSVVVAAGDLTAPRALSAGDLRIINLPRQALPNTAATNIDAVIGKTLTRSLAGNQIIIAADLSLDRDPASESALVPPGKVGFVLPANWLSSDYPKVRKKDLVTIYMAFPPSKQFPSGSGIVLDHVEVLSAVVEKSGSPSQIMIALDEMSVGRILQAHTSGYKLAAVVESAGARFPSAPSYSPSSTR